VTIAERACDLAKVRAELQDLPFTGATLGDVATALDEFERQTTERLERLERRTETAVKAPTAPKLVLIWSAAFSSRGSLPSLPDDMWSKPCPYVVKCTLANAPPALLAASTLSGALNEAHQFFKARTSDTDEVAVVEFFGVWND